MATLLQKSDDGYQSFIPHNVTKIIEAKNPNFANHHLWAHDVYKAIKFILAQKHEQDIQAKTAVSKSGSGYSGYFDASELEQVLLNLINNSIQALSGIDKANKAISIRAFKENNNACISVSDNGAGVTKELLDGLFELLTTTKETGMGLGLWLSKHIVNRYGGTIYYKQTIGDGAQFIVELPISSQA